MSSSKCQKAVITGIGPVSVAGVGKAAFLSSLLTQKQPDLGLIPGTDFYGYAITEDLPCPIPPHRKKRIDRTTELALTAAELALQDAKLQQGSDRWAVSFGSALAGFPPAEADHRSFLESGTESIPLSFATRLIGASLPGHIAIHYGITGQATANADSCAAGNRAIAEALHLIRRGDADVVIAGAAEAPLAPLTISSLSRLRVMSPSLACQPFTDERDGFILAEGASALVIESEAHALARGARIYATLSGCGASSEAHHMTSPDPSAQPVALAMRNALNDASLSTEDIDFINPHGSATQQNDSNEANAIAQLFGVDCPALQISKSQLGHSLGAASALEAAIVSLSLSGELPLPDQKANLGLNPKPTHAPKAAISNAFGFGGINSALCFEAYKSE